MSPFRFVQWISEGRTVTVYGDRQQWRDFTYMDDIAQGTLAALRPVGYEVINLGSDESIVLNDVIRLVERLVEREAKIEKRERYPADIMATWADISKAKRLLGWRPRMRFRDGVAKLVDWYRANRKWVSHVRTS